MAVFEQNQMNQPDVYLRFEVDKDETPALFLNITVDDSGAELLDLFCADPDQAKEFFTAVEAARAQWIELGGTL